MQKRNSILIILISAIILLPMSPFLEYASEKKELRESNIKEDTNINAVISPIILISRIPSSENMTSIQSIHPESNESTFVCEPHDITQSIDLKNKSGLNVYATLFYSRIDVYDSQNKSTATALSSLNSGAGINYQHKINSKWSILGELELNKNIMTQSDSSRLLLNTEIDTSKLNLSLNYQANENFEAYLRVNANDFLFLVPSGLNLNLSKKSLIGYGLGFNSRLPLGSFILTSSLGLDQYAPNGIGSINISSGQSFYGKIGASFNLGRMPIYTEAYFRQSHFGIYYPQSTNSFNQKNQEIGINLGIIFNF